MYGLMVRILIALVVLLACGAWMLLRWTRMPGRSFTGEAPAATDELRELAAELRADLLVLAGEIGERNVAHPEAYARAADWIAERLGETGLEVRREAYEARGRTFENLWVEIDGASSRELVVVGAHYDTATGSPGANDNGTGVVATLALARRFAAAEAPPRRLRFVLFANEEPPFFWTEGMGSREHVRRLAAAREEVTAMLSLETLGCYDDERGSQRYPFGVGWLYPDRGNFVAFVSDVRSRDLCRRSVGLFRERATIPSEGGALPRYLPGVGWSDHHSFWRAGYPALMVTDTAPFRDPRYHTQDDRVEHVDFLRLARVVEGVQYVVERLAR